MRAKHCGYINSEALSVTAKTDSIEKMMKFNALSPAYGGGTRFAVSFCPLNNRNNGVLDGPDLDHTADGYNNNSINRRRESLYL